MICGEICFFFNDTATTEIYTLSLPDALPISCAAATDAASPEAAGARWAAAEGDAASVAAPTAAMRGFTDRKSTRLNSSHGYISYAGFCLIKRRGQRGHRVQSQGRVSEDDGSH